LNQFKDRKKIVVKKVISRRTNSDTNNRVAMAKYLGFYRANWFA